MQLLSKPPFKKGGPCNEKEKHTKSSIQKLPAFIKYSAT
jgi:hypothetical protein